MFKFEISHSTNCSLPSDVSDRYNNLKISWDSLMEAASHGNPRSFYVAVTVVLEQLKREELKRKTRNQRNEAYFRFFLQAFCFPPSCNIR
jgi:hypothetical protein